METSVSWKDGTMEATPLVSLRNSYVEAIHPERIARKSSTFSKDIPPSCMTPAESSINHNN